MNIGTRFRASHVRNQSLFHVNVCRLIWYVDFKFLQFDTKSHTVLSFCGIGMKNLNFYNSTPTLTAHGIVVERLSIFTIGHPDGESWIASMFMVLLL
jgi:hypothetical protein